MIVNTIVDTGLLFLMLWFMASNEPSYVRNAWIMPITALVLAAAIIVNGLYALGAVR